MRLRNGTLSLPGAAHRKARLKLLISGDFCPRGRTEKLVLRNKAGAVFAGYRELSKAADMALTNLEAPLTRARTPILKTGPNLKISPECVRLLKDGGFDVVTLANNHIGDFGTAPVLETMTLLKDQGIRCVGAGPNLRAARKPLRLKRKGIGIAILNYAENEFGGAGSQKPGAATLDPLANIDQIRETAAKGDHVLVIIHGGNEHYPVPSPRMKQTYRAFIDAGAAAVIGNHTHCPQGLEIHHGKPIVYSLGNFLFDRASTAEGYDPADWWWTGYSVMLSLDSGGVMGVEIIPHHFGPDARKLRLLQGTGRRLFDAYLTRISGIIGTEKAFLQHWEAWCARRGPTLVGYLEKLRFPPRTRDETWNALVVRNTYTCEAHREVMDTFFRLIEENRLKQATESWPCVAAQAKAPAPLVSRLT